MKKISWHLSKLLEKIYRYNLRKKVKNKNFTIISNNCWAGRVYDDLGLQYTTPTIGLFFYAPCYIKFISSLQHYINSPLQFKEHSFYPEANKFREQKMYPIGVLDDIEIHFLHYKTNEEAFEKWNRRSARINYDNLFANFSDRDLCTIEHMKTFDNCNIKNKILFSSKNYPGLKSLVWFKQNNNDDFIGDPYQDAHIYRKYFDVAKWLNKTT